MSGLVAFILGFLGTALICLLLALIFMPTLVAWCNHDKNTIWIFLVNLVAGWTGLFWVLALFWALLERDDIDLIEKIREKLSD